MRRILILFSALILVSMFPGCMTISAIFNSENIIKKQRNRGIITVVFGAGDLAMVAPGVGRLGNHIIGNNTDKGWPSELWGLFMVAFGWQLILKIDALFAAILKKIIWDEPLFSHHEVPSLPSFDKKVVKVC